MPKPSWTVYKITCTENGRYYIGIAQDYIGHRNRLFGQMERDEVLHNPEMNEDYLKYNKNKSIYKHERLCECTSKEEALVEKWVLIVGAENRELIYNQKEGRMKSVPKELFVRPDVQELVRRFGLKSLLR